MHHEGNDALRMVHVGTCAQNPPLLSPYGLKQIGHVVPSYVKVKVLAKKLISPICGLG